MKKEYDEEYNEEMMGRKEYFIFGCRRNNSKKLIEAINSSFKHVYFVRISLDGLQLISIILY
jgi:hypothetical protein